MPGDRIEAKWIESFPEAFRLCGVGAAEPVRSLSETQSRKPSVHLGELALCRLDARPFHIVVPTPALTAPVRALNGCLASPGAQRAAGASAFGPEWAKRAARTTPKPRLPFENYDDLCRIRLLGLCVPKRHGGLDADGSAGVAVEV
jgi:hypothetical protein